VNTVTCFHLLRVIEPRCELSSRGMRHAGAGCQDIGDNYLIMRYLTNWNAPTNDEAAFKASANRKNLIAIAIIATGMYALCAKSGDAPRIPRDSYHVLVSAALFVLSAAALVAELVVRPPPKRGDRIWNTLEPIGHAAYFTHQIIMLQAVYCGYGLAAALSESPGLAAMVQYLAVWVATQSAALTLLFFKNNWYEPRWHRDVLVTMEGMYPGWKYLVLFSNSVPCVVAVADLLLLKDPAALYNHGMSLGTMSMVILMYSALYTAWTKLLQQVVRPGTLVYPFIADLNTPRRIGVFIFLQWVAVLFVGCLLWLFCVSLRLKL
jgi:hypothetical protein